MCPPNVRERQYLGSRPRVVWGEPPPVLCGLDETNTRTPSSSATVSAASERLTCRTFRHGCRDRMARTLNGLQVSTIGNGAGCHPKIHLAYHEARIALVSSMISVDFFLQYPSQSTLSSYFLQGHQRRYLFHRASAHT